MFFVAKTIHIFHATSASACRLVVVESNVFTSWNTYDPSTAWTSPIQVTLCLIILLVQVSFEREYFMVDILTSITISWDLLLWLALHCLF